MSEKPAYKRVLLKVSGEALMGAGEYGLDADTMLAIARDVRGVTEMGLEVSVSSSI